MIGSAAAEIWPGGHVRLALSIAYRLLRDEGAAHEVVQDAFVDLWRTAPEIDAERSAVTTWLVRLVRLRSIDRLRHDGAERRGAGRVDADLGAALDVAATDDVASNVLDAERSGRIRAALDELPADQRRIVELAFLAGHTHAEFAQLMELPIDTIAGKRDLAIVAIDGTDPTDVERIIVTTEPAGGSDEPSAEEVVEATV